MRVFWVIAQGRQSFWETKSQLQPMVSHLSLQGSFSVSVPAPSSDYFSENLAYSLKHKNPKTCFLSAKLLSLYSLIFWLNPALGIMAS